MKAIKEMEGFAPGLEVLGYVWPFNPKPDGTLKETPSPASLVVTKEEYDIIAPIMERARASIGYDFVIKFRLNAGNDIKRQEYPPTKVKFSQSERDMWTRKNKKNNDSP